MPGSFIPIVSEVCPDSTRFDNNPPVERSLDHAGVQMGSPPMIAKLSLDRLGSERMSIRESRPVQVANRPRRAGKGSRWNGPGPRGQQTWPD